MYTYTIYLKGAATTIDNIVVLDLDNKYKKWDL